MNFLERLHETLDQLHLLNHPFYQNWSQGTLSRSTLGLYAQEYYKHVAAFPRYISGIHASCSQIKARQVLLENLIEEEQGEKNHPELWLRFAEGLGVSRADCAQEAKLSKTCALVEGYFRLVQSGYATGLGALYAYERQTPEVSRSKIKGLREHYGINHSHHLEFFEVHQHADEWHREAVAELIEDLDEDRCAAALGAERGAKLLWSFLDGMVDAAMHDTLSSPSYV